MTSAISLVCSSNLSAQGMQLGCSWNALYNEKNYSQPEVTLLFPYHCIICCACRKRPTDASGAEFDSAISHVFQVLTSFSGELLCRLKTSSGVINGSEYDFAERICKLMVSLGSTNLQCISADSGALALYLKQVLISIPVVLNL